jgi:uncharacterized protein (DUF1499 family)
MHLLPWLLSFCFPLCATTGASGIAAPGIVDFTHFSRAPYSSAFIAPPGFSTQANITAPVFNIPAAKLFSELQAVATAQPRTTRLDIEPAQYQAAYVVRSPAANFPDIVEIAALPMGPDHSSYIFYTHSIYGRYDFGVNLSRAKIWAAALQQVAQ